MERIEVRFAWWWQPSSNEVINIYFFSFLLDNIALTRMILIHEVINCVGCYFRLFTVTWHSPKYPSVTPVRRFSECLRQFLIY
jgi:hypothetical protein